MLTKNDIAAKLLHNLTTDSSYVTTSYRGMTFSTYVGYDHEWTGPAGVKLMGTEAVVEYVWNALTTEQKRS